MRVVARPHSAAAVIASTPKMLANQPLAKPSRSALLRLRDQPVDAGPVAADLTDADADAHGDSLGGVSLELGAAAGRAHLAAGVASPAVISASR